MRRILLSLGLFVLLCAPALAGNLFPPVGAGASTECPAGKKALRWTGDSLTCMEPSDGLTIPECPAGTVMKGVTNGVPDCVAGGGGGGMYKTKVICAPMIVGVGGGGCGPSLCINANPLTGGCSCPVGFTAKILGTSSTTWVSGMAHTVSENFCIYCGGPCP